MRAQTRIVAHGPAFHRPAGKDSLNRLAYEDQSVTFYGCTAGLTCPDARCEDPNLTSSDHRTTPDPRRCSAMGPRLSSYVALSSRTRRVVNGSRQIRVSVVDVPGLGGDHPDVPPARNRFGVEPSEQSTSSQRLRHPYFGKVFSAAPIRQRNAERARPRVRRPAVVTRASSSCDALPTPLSCALAP